MDGPAAPTRRDVLKGAVGAAVGVQALTRVRFAVPRGACDCHIHVFDDRARFPFASDRVYTPAPATVAQARALHRALGVSRTVVVQPSVYGTDNRSLLEALRRLGASARGVAVIDDRTTDAELEELHRAGVRGVRLNLETAGQTDPAVGRQRLAAAVNRVRTRAGWHVQVYTRPSVVAQVAGIVNDSPVPVVFDHFGGTRPADGLRQPGFEALLDLVKAGRAYVKISGAYRVSAAAPAYADVEPLAKALIAANIDRVVWGTDWPHVDSAARPGRLFTDEAPHLAIDAGLLMNQLETWAPDPAQRQKILVDNPARLYGF